MGVLAALYNPVPTGDSVPFFFATTIPNCIDRTHCDQSKVNKNIFKITTDTKKMIHKKEWSIIRPVADSFCRAAPYGKQTNDTVNENAATKF